MGEHTWWVILAVMVVLALCLLAWRRAVRIDMVHRKVVQMRANLDALLVRRSHAALALAGANVLDPASSALIAQAAEQTLSVSPRLTADRMEPQRLYSLADTAMTKLTLPRHAVESQLTQVLRATLTPAVRAELDQHHRSRQLMVELDRVSQQVCYARRFHNDHVARARALRANLLVRAARLAGKAPLPEPVDIDDDLRG